jgi:hypothetical protein
MPQQFHLPVLQGEPTLQGGFSIPSWHPINGGFGGSAILPTALPATMVIFFRLLRKSPEANAIRNCRNRPAQVPEHLRNCTEMRGGLVLALDRPLAPL